MATLQRELARKNMELTRLNEQKNELIGTVAHDLRTPLSIILAYSEFLIDEVAALLSPDHAHFLALIRSSTQHMIGLVGGLLDISAIEAGKMSISLREIDIVELARNTMILHNIMAQKKQIALTLRADRHIPPVLADRLRLEQLLNNLLANALKFSPMGGAIEIAVRQDGDSVVLAVSDSGPGILSSHLGRLFDPFEAAEAPGMAGPKGAGLGLAIVRKIIEAHGGEIRVETEVNRGSTFSVSLPIEPRYGS